MDDRIKGPGQVWHDGGLFWTTAVGPVVDRACILTAAQDPTLAIFAPWMAQPVLDGSYLHYGVDILPMVMERPEVWMSDRIVMRRVGERGDWYQFRMLCAMWSLGLFGQDGTGTDIPVVVDEDDLELKDRLFRGAFMNEECPEEETMRRAWEDAADRAWPDGYNRDAMIDLASSCADTLAYGSLVVQTLAVIALYDRGPAELAKRDETDMAGMYGEDVWDGASGPEGLRRWAADRIEVPAAMFDMLEGLGLEPEGLADDYRTKWGLK